MIYDFEKADKAMEKLGVDPIQFHLLYLLYHRSTDLSSSAQIERFRHQVLENEDPTSLRKRIDKLEKLGLLENLSATTGEGPNVKRYNTEYMVVTEKFVNTVISVDAFEELWQKYPAAFPLGQGGHFLARVGDKDELENLYERKIKRDIKKHKFILEMLEEFINLVNSGKINGVKIGNFIAAEMWDTVAEISKSNITITDHGDNI